MSIATKGLWFALGLGMVATLMPEAMFAAAPGSSPVLLNEIMADPNRDWDGDGVYSFKDDEWVEIINVSDAPVVLDGYRLAGADTAWRYEFSGVLNPGRVQVVYGSQSTAWEAANGEAQFGLRLSNSGGSLLLWKLEATDTVLVDCYAYQDHEAEDDRSTGRAPDGAAEWRVMDGLNPHAGSELPSGTGCAPSPGGLISCPTPVESSTWGRIKDLYKRF